ncbi:MULTISPECIES: DUF2793 domain-containing protein [unclassified Rhizobium]|uniref:DUF2793 domain-containing protein n=1 Tax=unclassified Rhizobium TaxID=2613769 RepID=UPI001ADD1BF9|nr:MULTISPECIES: DUF2793 domain-containing protein [unclassified Rhizobium]MBO9099251.1 DUF2793 domain-containing protein [Rhizobium sp. L58/93]MBO9131943.1 DUF2793 domain-containing protein [Rhizobium sp. B209b/85]MBO9169513.1 DUF2793 domain-containing protein [Rhizobium sp. L245/93]MBO9185464.1 DUF2793 domain-containing protein [Rhizobium sp. E27B/91]QXZ85597.1 DUF2793 domain-containing protein [Rhizobium sp. K1/93]
MSDQTANLSLPYILPSQAQKHVTHNEALQRLDAIVQLAITATRSSPPPDPISEGDCYLVASAATGIWSGKSGQLALRQDGAWIFLQPRTGWRAWFTADNRLRVLEGGTWSEMSLPSEGTMSALGINASADATNRLTVSAAATLFNNAGNGHQIKVNKNSSGDTASLLFQTGWSGRAELGLAGNDSFSIKVSPDGGTWQTGLSVSPQGIVDMPQQPAARASLAVGALTPSSGSQTGFTQLSAARGGFALGTSLGGSLGNRLVVPVAGLYLLSMSASILTSGGHSASLVANGSTTLATTSAVASSNPFRHSGVGLATLNAGDLLTLLHSGTAQYDFGAGKTEITIVRL